MSQLNSRELIGASPFLLYSASLDEGKPLDEFLFWVVDPFFSRIWDLGVLDTASVQGLYHSQGSRTKTAVYEQT
jgi:hypothetical protein